MDEIDFLKYLNKILKILAIISLIPYILIACLLLFDGTDIVELKEFTFTYLKVFGCIVLLQLLAYLVYKVKFKSQFSISSKTNKDISREIMKKYSPAIYSFLYNKKIESYTDYTATILNLEQKGYIKLKKDDKGEYNIISLNSNIEGLSKHEKYAMEVIQKKHDFYKDEFIAKVLEDLIALKLIKKKENKEEKTNKTLTIFIILVIISMIMFCISFIAKAYMEVAIKIALAIFIIAVIIPLVEIFTKTIIIAVNENIVNIKITKLGKEVQKEVYGLKNYIKEYTLLSERNIEYKELFDRYIAYAICLGESKAVEKFVSKNEQYRNLIYNKSK